MKRKFIIKLASILMLSFGLFLLLVNIAGFIIDVKVKDDYPRFLLKPPVAGYSFSLAEKDQLIEMLNEPLDNFDIEGVNNAVFETIAHSGRRKISLFENWLLWFGGRIYEPVGRTQDPWRIVTGGKALCSEAAAVFNHIAKKNGHEVRFLQLGGHVVSEIKTRDGWIVVDPDFGVVFPQSRSYLESKAGIPMIRQALQKRGFGEEKIDVYIRMFQTPLNNRSFHAGDEMSPKLLILEHAADWMKWIIPMIMLVLAFVVRRLARNVD